MRGFLEGALRGAADLEVLFLSNAIELFNFRTDGLENRPQ